MKHKYFYFLPLISAVSFLSSCDKKSQEELSQQAEEVKTEIKEAVDKVVTPKISALDENIEMGFVQHLPSNTEFIVDVYDVKGALDRFLATDLGGLLKELAIENGVSVDDALSQPMAQIALNVLGEEIVFATGEGAAQQLSGLVEAYDEWNVASMAGFASLALEGDYLDSVEMFKPDYFESEEGKAFFDKLALPPLYMGVKISDEEIRNNYLTIVQGQLAQILEERKEFMEPVKKDIQGQEFQGFQITGEVLAELVRTGSYEGIAEALGEASADVIVEAMEKKNVVALVGNVGEYLVIYMGSSEDELVFAEDKTQSLLAREDVTYLGNHSGDDLLAYIHASDEVMRSLAVGHGSFEGLIAAMTPILKELDSDKVDGLLATLQNVIAAEREYYSLLQPSGRGVVMHFEEGLKIESYGQADVPLIDLKAKRNFAAVESALEPVFFANWSSQPEDNKVLLDYFESIAIAAYEGANLISVEGADHSEIAEFQQMFNLFETSLKKDCVQLWESLSDDLTEGLGAECAIVMDLKGEMPTVPMIPKPILGMALPRVLVLSDVKDRARLTSSWTKFNTSAENLLKIASEMSGQNFPMQKPSKSRADGLTTWSFPIPMTTDNCKPCLSVSDEIFMLSSSPEFAEQVAEAVAKKAETSPSGSYAVLNFDPLYQYSEGWLDMLNENAEMALGEYQVTEFREITYPLAKRFLEAVDQLENMTVKTTAEGEEMRSVIHFKMR